MEQREESYESGAELLKALRLQIVRGLLRFGCHNVSCMERNIGQSQPCISQHLNKLRAAGVVRAERAGNEMRYTVSDPRAAQIVAALFGDRREDYTDV